MKHPEYSSVDPNNGDVTWNGPLSHEKGDHTHMPPRTEAYLPGEHEFGFDEKGHNNASSLGGVNNTSNVVAQNADVNHGAYYSLEEGERSALQNGASIDSEKIAVVDGQPGGRPSTFMVNDEVTYADGHTESIHNSFTNIGYSTQQMYNDQTAALPGTFDAPNPGDTLRDSMSTTEYAELMEETDAALPGIEEDYAAADCSGFDTQAEASADAGVSVGDDGGASCDPDD